MTETGLTEDSQIAAFMHRAARAYGRGEAAPDPAVIWLKAALERHMAREQRALRVQALSFAFAALAITVAILVAYRLVAPVFATLGDVGLLAGIAMIVALPLIWLVGIRPLSDAR
jgi:hypothetical protein